MSHPQTGFDGMTKGRMKIAMKVKLAAIAQLLAQRASFKTLHQAAAPTMATTAEKVRFPTTPRYAGSAEC